MAIPFPEISPVLFELGPLVIRWYALAYIAGLLLGWRYVIYLQRQSRLWIGGQPPLSGEQIDDLLLWIALGVILGGRLGYVLIYQPGYFLSNPDQIIAVWHGGMSFHGGLAGVIVAILWFAHRRGLNMLSVGDLVAAATPIGLFFGRIANFINSELWGRPTDMPWGVIFPNGGPLPRHPSQIYEALLEGLLLFLLINLLIHKASILKKPGMTIGIFAVVYGISRAFVELFRQPDPQLGFIIGGLTMGMLLSLPMVLAGAALIYWVDRNSDGTANRRK